MNSAAQLVGLASASRKLFGRNPLRSDGPMQDTNRGSTPAAGGGVVTVPMMSRRAGL